LPDTKQVFSQNIIALVYDFDGTLSLEAMQHYGVLPSLDIKPSDFWGSVKEKRKETRAEELLVYMHEMIKLADQKDVKLDRDQFKEHGQTIEFFKGVETWFGRFNEYVASICEDEDVIVEHYIISAGLREMIEGCSIVDEFREIYACEFAYDQYGHPEWPRRIVSDTSKTQYLFRINKGVLDVNESINSHMPLSRRRIPFDNMIYFGDGDTDVPSMAVVMANGGHAVAVHPPEEINPQKCLDLRAANRIDYFCPANYSEGSELDQLVKKTLSVIVSRTNLRRRIFDLPPEGAER
jgi:hypothetical protein